MYPFGILCHFAQVEVLSFEFASTTLFIACILTELFLYCYYGNEVTVEVRQTCIVYLPMNGTSVILPPDT